MASQQNGGNAVPDFTVKAGLAQMLKGGVIMDVVNAEQVSLFFPFFSQIMHADTV
jgi:pyridoxal 5'-phosphate synthase pdxS subunit